MEHPGWHHWLKKGVSVGDEHSDAVLYLGKPKFPFFRQTWVIVGLEIFRQVTGVLLRVPKIHDGDGLRKLRAHQSFRPSGAVAQENLSLGLANATAQGLLTEHGAKVLCLFQ